MDFQPDVLITLAGVVLSLAFAYLPWLKDWFDGMDSKFKPLFMAGVLLLVTAGKLAVDCRLDAACLALNWQAAGWAWFVALVANQTTFTVAVKQPQQEELHNYPPERE